MMTASSTVCCGSEITARARRYDVLQQRSGGSTGVGDAGGVGSCATERIDSSSIEAAHLWLVSGGAFGLEWGSPIPMFQGSTIRTGRQRIVLDRDEVPKETGAISSKKQVDARPFFYPLSAIRHFRFPSCCGGVRNINSIRSPYGIIPSALILQREEVASVCNSLRQAMRLGRAKVQ